MLEFKFDDQSIGEVKIVGRWYPLADLYMRLGEGYRARIAADKTIGPVIDCQLPGGQILPAFLVSTPAGRPFDDLAMILTCERIPQTSEDGEPLLLFIGAFDPRSTTTDPARETTFLALQYPVSDFEELRERLGTIDLHEPPLLGS